MSMGQIRALLSAGVGRDHGAVGIIRGHRTIRHPGGEIDTALARGLGRGLVLRGSHLDGCPLHRDGVYEEVSTGVVARGPDEITAFIADTYAALPVAQVTPRRGFQVEDWAVMEADFSGESAAGASFSIPFLVVFEQEGDKIVRNADYFDLSSFMAQLGAPPTATPAA
jgi:limonene-1,2-epoxide hydrolase